MKVLIARKTTRLDAIGEYVRKKVAEGVLPLQHLERMKKGHLDHQNTLFDLKKCLKKNKIEYSEVFPDSYWPDVGTFDLVISVGGDGTVLDASHHIQNDKVAIVGLKSSDLSVGHLCGYSRGGIEQMIQSFLEGLLKPVMVSRLKAKIYTLATGTEQLTSPILNDVLFCNTNPAATTRYTIKLGERVEKQSSSGVWVSTAAGSSAAISAAGGEKIKLTDEKFQYCVRELFTAEGDNRGELDKGFFYPDGSAFVLENLSDSALLSLDGHYHFYTLGYGDRISFSEAPSLSLIK